MNAPALSVIVPVYNAGAYVLEAVESILAQDCDIELEIIIVNDHSTDPATLDALDKLSARAANIRVLQNNGRQGPGAARNVGIRAARGNWIGFLDADDVWPPGSLKVRWDVVRDVPDANWIAGYYDIWKSDGSLAPHPTFDTAVFDKVDRLEAYWLLHDIARELVGNNMLVWIGTVLVRKALLDETHGFREDLIYGEDWYLFMNLAIRTDLHFVPAVVAHLRRQDDSLTTQDAALSPLAYRAWKLAYFDSVFKSYRRNIRWKVVAINRSLSDDHLLKGNKLLAAKHAVLALLWGPNDVGQFTNALGRLAGLLCSRYTGRRHFTGSSDQSRQE